MFLRSRSFTLLVLSSLLVGCTTAPSQSAPAPPPIDRDSYSSAPSLDPRSVNPVSMSRSVDLLVKNGNFQLKGMPHTSVFINKNQGKIIIKATQNLKEPTEKLPENSFIQMSNDTTDSTSSLQARIDEFVNNLKKAIYKIYSPAQIEVAKFTTVYLQLIPNVSDQKVTGEIEEHTPKDVSLIASGDAKWASVMEATLSGDDFEIDPVKPVRKTVSGIATWSWEIKPKNFGEKLPLMFKVNAVLLSEKNVPPYEVVILKRDINVQVTVWWLFDHYFDKYWKWLLSGLVGIAASCFGLWWKEKIIGTNFFKRHKGV